jgi:hypothetical protein
MNWINAPATLKRFTLQQVLQHFAAIVLGSLLMASALLPGLFGGLHGEIGLAAAAMFCLHLFSLLVTGVRHDVAIEHIAFLPFGESGAGNGGDPPAGKYLLPEKRDYFLILCWSFVVVATGVCLNWPGKFGIPGPKAFSWLRILHVAGGGGWVLHVFGCHVPARFLDALPGMRYSIFTGRVPLESVEARPGWTRSLVDAGVLVPVPVEQQAETQRETLQVRELLDEGNRLTREGLYDEASAVFEEALRLYPEYSQARFNLGVSRVRQGRPDLAAEHFRIFLESDPFNPMADKARELLGGISRPAEGGDL